MTTEKKYLIKISPRGQNWNFPFYCGGNQANVDWLKMQVGKHLVATRHGLNHYKFVENGYTIHIFDAYVAKELASDDGSGILNTSTKENTNMLPDLLVPTVYVYIANVAVIGQRSYIESNIGGEFAEKHNFGTREAAEKWIRNIKINPTPFVYYGIEVVR